MTTIINLACIADASIREATLGAGRSDYLPIGLHGGNIHRSFMKFAQPDWVGLGIVGIVSARIALKNSSAAIVTRGASPRVIAQRCAQAWSEGTATTLVSTNAIRWGNQPNMTSAGEVATGILATADGARFTIDITAIARSWAPATVASGGGQPNYGLRLRSYDEAATSRTTEVWSRESAYDPVLILEVETNTAPEAPINVDPAGGDIGEIVGGLISFSGERVDADVGDYVDAVQVQVYANGATDGSPGTAIIDRVVTFTDHPSRFVAPISSTLLTVGTPYRWRAKTRDRHGAWSPWSPLADAQFIPDSPPSAPTNLAVDQTTVDPTFSGTIVDPDGDDLGAVRILVYQDTALGAVLMWDSGWATSGGTRFAVNYGGLPLTVGERFRWAAQVRDEWGGEGPLSAYQTWTVAAITGPDAMSPIDVEMLQDSITPTLTIGHSANFDAYELEVGRFADGSGLVWDVGVTAIASTGSTGVVYAGTVLTWGRTYYWRAKVRVAGTTWTEWSPWYPFYVDALPVAPVGSVDGSVDSGLGTYGPYHTITTATATLRFPFSDPDVGKGYAEAPTRREIEIVRADTLAAFGASPYVITSGITDTMVTGTLTAELTYKARARYDDGSGQRSPWSEWLFFKRSVAPVAAAGTAVDATDANPLLDWTFTSSPGKAQAGFRAKVFANVSGNLVVDSGFVASAVTEYEVPGEILANATAYRWQVTVYDTDLLTGVYNSSAWTTAFTTPDELTNLVATGDAGDSSVLLAWDASTTNPDADHFWRYYIYRLDPATGTYERIGSVDDIATPTFTDLEAPHGGSTYAVTVSNGFAESDFVTVVVTLDLRWWLSDPNDASLRFEVRYVSGWRARNAAQQDAFEPLGRDVPVVVSGALLAPAGSFNVFLTYEDAGILDLLRRAAKVSPYVVLKDPFGDTYRMRLGSIDQDRGAAGAQTLTVEYRTVA